jgi:hypothetical protein
MSTTLEILQVKKEFKQGHAATNLSVEYALETKNPELATMIFRTIMQQAFKLSDAFGFSLERRGERQRA